jgi:trigger factor
MNVTVEAGIGQERHVSVEVEAAEVDRQIDRVAVELAKSVAIPGGYTKFKAKLARAKQMLRSEILARSSLELVEGKLGEAVVKSGLKTIGTPRLLELRPVLPGTPYSFTVLVEVRPSLDDVSYKGLVIPVVETEASTEEVDQALAALQKEAARLVDYSGERLVEGLHVTLAVQPVSEDEKIRAALSSEAVHVVLSKGRIADGLLAALVGQPPAASIQIREKAAAMPLYCPQAHETLELEWKVTVTKAEVEQLPPLDDQFAAETKGLKSLLALRGQLREEIGQRKKSEAERARELAIKWQLRKRNRFGLPTQTVSTILEDRMKAYEDSLEKYRKYYGEDTVKSLVEHHRLEALAAAQAETAAYLLFEAIAEKEGIAVTPEDVEQRIQDLAKADGVSPAYVKSKLKEKGDDREMDFLIRHERVIQRLLELGVQKPYDEFMRAMRAERKRGALRKRTWFLKLKRSRAAWRARRMP